MTERVLQEELSELFHEQSNAPAQKYKSAEKRRPNLSIYDELTKIQNSSIVKEHKRGLNDTITPVKYVAANQGKVPKGSEKIKTSTSKLDATISINQLNLNQEPSQFIEPEELKRERKP